MTTERDPVMPVTRYCDILWQWLDLLCERAKEDDARDEQAKVNYGSPTDFQRIRDIAPTIKLAVQKSNYLARRIYAGEPHRIEPCPKHKGRWSGWGQCDYGCSNAPFDITGWLPAHVDLSGRSAEEVSADPEFFVEINARSSYGMLWAKFHDLVQELATAAIRRGDDVFVRQGIEDADAAQSVRITVEKRKP